MTRCHNTPMAFGKKEAARLHRLIRLPRGELLSELRQKS